MTSKTKSVDTTSDEEKEVYKCTDCGKKVYSPDGVFYKASYSELWRANNGFASICKHCIDEKFDELSRRYSSDRMAMLICCHYLDIPFYNSLFDSIIMSSTSDITVGQYLKYLNARQYANKTFLNTLVDQEAEGISALPKIEEHNELWTESDKKSRDVVLNILKYDPFEVASDSQRRFMFNLCFDYFQNDDIVEDSHKIQGVIEIVKTYSQINKINIEIEKEFLEIPVNYKRISDLSDTKKNFMALINTFAKDNGISGGMSKKSIKGSASLAYYTKILDEIDFTDAKVNLYDIKTCESMRQFADISNQSILNQIHLNEDDLGDMLGTQTKMIYDLREKTDKLNEENRLLRIENGVLKEHKELLIKENNSLHSQLNEDGEA